MVSSFRRQKWEMTALFGRMCCFALVATTRNFFICLFSVCAEHGDGIHSLGRVCLLLRRSLSAHTGTLALLLIPAALWLGWARFTACLGCSGLLILGTRTVLYCERSSRCSLLEVALVLSRGRWLELWIWLVLIFDAFDVGIVGGGRRLFICFELAVRCVRRNFIFILHLFARLLLIGVPVRLKLISNLLHGVKRIWGGSYQLQEHRGAGLTWRWVGLGSAIQIWVRRRRLIWKRIAKRSNTTLYNILNFARNQNLPLVKVLVPNRIHTVCELKSTR